MKSACLALASALFFATVASAQTHLYANANDANAESWNTTTAAKKWTANGTTYSAASAGNIYHLNGWQIRGGRIGTTSGTATTTFSGGQLVIDGNNSISGIAGSTSAHGILSLDLLAAPVGPRLGAPGSVHQGHYIGDILTAPSGGPGDTPGTTRHIRSLNGVISLNGTLTLNGHTTFSTSNGVADLHFTVKSAVTGPGNIELSGGNGDTQTPQVENGWVKWAFENLSGWQGGSISVKARHTLSFVNDIDFTVTNPNASLEFPSTTSVGFLNLSANVAFGPGKVSYGGQLLPDGTYTAAQLNAIWNTGGYATFPFASGSGTLTVNPLGVVPSTPHVRLLSVTRSPNNPLISSATHTGIGSNITMPSVLRAPAWLPSPLGQYYMYFAAHDGGYIRLATANNPHGPWTNYTPGTLKDTEVAPFSNTISSPDVFTRDGTQKIRMYFSCDSYPGSTEQWSGVSESSNGINFTLTSTENIAKYYLRVFEWNGLYYGMQKGWSTAPAELGVSVDGIQRFNHIKTFTEHGSIRHMALLLKGDVLLVFYSKIGDAPERILLSTIKLTGDPSTWTLSDPIEVLRPTLAYEGANYANVASVKGAATNVNQLRDPYVFEEDGKTYLYYSIAGETGIAMAEIEYELVSPDFPVITAQPASQAADLGADATFTVTAVGNPAPSYQWKKNGTDLPGATTASLLLTNVQQSDAGNYTVVVSNTSGSVTSSPATLTVNLPAAPSITTQPASQTADTGANVTFTVTATGSPAPTYQWKKDSVDLPGATDASLTLTGVSSADAGNYTVVVTNASSSVTSNAATLTVNLPAGPAITTQPATQTVEAGANVTFTVAATGSPAPTYQWKKDGTNISGATNPSLTLNNVQPSDAGAYTVVVSNASGAVTSDTATLTVAQVAPAITAHPASQTAGLGASVAFSVTATGNPAPSYQWKKDGVDLPGATNASLTLINVQLADAGDYTVVVSNTMGSLTSNPATLTVSALPPEVDFYSNATAGTNDNWNSAFSGRTWTSDTGASYVAASAGNNIHHTNGYVIRAGRIGAPVGGNTSSDPVPSSAFGAHRLVIDGFQSASGLTNGSAGGNGRITFELADPGATTGSTWTMPIGPRGCIQGSTVPAYSTDQATRASFLADIIAASNSVTMTPGSGTTGLRQIFGGIGVITLNGTLVLNGSLQFSPPSSISDVLFTINSAVTGTGNIELSGGTAGGIWENGWIVWAFSNLGGWQGSLINVLNKNTLGIAADTDLFTTNPGAQLAFSTSSMGFIKLDANLSVGSGKFVLGATVLPNGVYSVAALNAAAATAGAGQTFASGTGTLYVGQALPSSGPAITTSSPLPAGTVGSAYSQTLAATGGTLPYSWSVTAGSLPAGLSLSGAGVISGTPSAPAAASFTVQVTDDNAQSASQGFSLTIDPAPLTYVNWTGDHFTLAEQADPNISGPPADPESDGLSNLLEYALGTNPRADSSDNLPVAVPVLNSGDGQTYLTLTAYLLADVTDITVEAEVSGNMTVWLSGPDATETVSDTTASGVRTLVIRDRTSLEAGSRRFIRLRVTQL